MFLELTNSFRKNASNKIFKYYKHKYNFQTLANFYFNLFGCSSSTIYLIF